MTAQPYSESLFVNGIELRPIPDFPDYYASKDGNVWSMKRRARCCKPPTEPRLMKSFMTGSRVGNHYRGVVLHGGGIEYKRTIGWCILSAWISPRPEGMEVCHGIAGRLNDSLNNLRWGTRSSNAQDRSRDGTMAEGEKHGLSKLTNESVKMIMNSTEGSVELGKRLNVTPRTVAYVRAKKTWKHITLQGVK